MEVDVLYRDKAPATPDTVETCPYRRGADRRNVGAEYRAGLNNGGFHWPTDGDLREERGVGGCAATVLLTSRRGVFPQLPWEPQSGFIIRLAFSFSKRRTSRLLSVCGDTHMLMFTCSSKCCFCCTSDMLVCVVRGIRQFALNFGPKLVIIL